MDAADSSNAGDGFDNGLSLYCVPQCARESYGSLLHVGREPRLRTSSRTHQPLVDSFQEILV